MVAAAGVQATAMDDESKKEIALWRVAVLGPLISARLEHGDRRALLEVTRLFKKQRRRSLKNGIRRYLICC
jgi:hypothetical protein